MKTEQATKHTPTPWRYVTHADKRMGDCIRGGRVRTEDGATVPPAVCTMSKCEGWETQQANAARIVQCVNACEGIEDPASALKQARQALTALKAGMAPDGHISASEMEYIASEALRALGG